jgi:hypothetical protein
MSLVYGNAAVNIAATNAKDGTAGLFFQRDSFGVRRQYISNSGGRNFGVLDNRFYDRCISESPLSSRAWAFQERYIAHHTLHFSAEQIFWECCEEMACETWPDGIATSMTDLFARKFPGREDFTVATGWEQAIKFYAGCQLTYLHDKMVAISGVARRFQSQTHDQYVAGLWRKDIERQLCWRVDHKNEIQDPEIGAIQYRAPSRSWASTDEPVTWRLWLSNGHFLGPLVGTLLIKVLGVDCVSVGGDTMGQLQDATLHIACHVMIHGIVNLSFKILGLMVLKNSAPECLSAFETFRIESICYFGPLHSD